MVNIFLLLHAEGNVKLLIKGKKLIELTSIPAYSLLRFMSHFTGLSWWTCLLIGWCSVVSEEGNSYTRLSVFWADFWGNYPSNRPYKVVFWVFVDTHSTFKPKYSVNTTISPKSDILKDQVFQMWSYKLDSWQKNIFKIQVDPVEFKKD